MSRQFVKIAFLAFAVLLQSNCEPIGDPGPIPIDLFETCVTSKTCRLNGQLITYCDKYEPLCPLWAVFPGDRVEVRIAEVWPRLDRQNDLLLGGDVTRDSVDLTFELLFDGVPVTEQMCERASSDWWSGQTCKNISRSIRQIEFRYVSPFDTDIRQPVHLNMTDVECIANPEICPP